MTGVISTERLLLTPLHADDAEAMAGVLADPDLYVFTGGAPPTVDELRARYERQTVGRSPDGRERWLNWVVRTASDRAPVGYVQATVVHDGGLAEVAWVVGTPWQGRGYAGEAARAVVGWLREHGVRRIVAHVHHDHAASAAVALVAGLAPSGVYDDDEQRWVLER